MAKNPRPGRPPKNRRPNLQKCPTSGKVRFRDKSEATNALHAAATSRAYAETDGVSSSRQECRAYSCTGCKGWHLTSRPRKI